MIKRNLSIILATLAVAIVVALPSSARAQFISGGVSAFEPQIDVVNSGVLQDVQATVSADRRYVTITARPTNAQLMALRPFSFQTGGGIQLPVGGVNTAAVPVLRANVVNPPVTLGTGVGVVLSQRGMTRILSTNAPKP